MLFLSKGEGKGERGKNKKVEVKVKDKVENRVEKKVKYEDNVNKVILNCALNLSLKKVSTLTLICLLLLLIVSSFIPATAGAVSVQPGEIYGMRKYSAWGHVSLQYEDTLYEANNAQKSHYHAFSENVRLNFRSYLASPKFMYYTISTGLDTSQGNTSQSDHTTKTYGIETVFFPFRPLSFTMRASKVDGWDSETTNYGLSMTFTRKIRPRRLVPVVKAEENVNVNVNTNENSNSNINAGNDEGAGENENITENSNIAPKPKPKIKMEPESNGFLRDLYYSLPGIVALNTDRVDIKHRDSRSKWDNASLRFLGKASDTGYNLNLDYDMWERDGTKHEGYGSDLITETFFYDSFFQRLNNYIFYRKNDVQSYNIHSQLTSITQKWSYGLYGRYSRTSKVSPASGYTQQYSLFADIMNSTDDMYKDIRIRYGATLGFERSGDKNDFYGQGRVSANKSLSRSLTLRSSLSSRVGSRSKNADFNTGIAYVFRPRKGYAANIEINPEDFTLKATSLEPQVGAGWDYSIRTGYTFGVLWRSGDLYRSGSSISSRRTLLSHIGNLGLGIFAGSLTFSSDAVYQYYVSERRNIRWDNILTANIFTRVRFTLGANYSKDMPVIGTDATNYSAYNLITYNLMRNTLLRLDSKYTKEKPSNMTTTETTPSILWAFKKLFAEASVTYKKYKPNGDSERTERKIFFRITRPFNIP